MKLNRLITITLSISLIAGTASTAYAAKGGKKNNGTDDPGYVDATFIADSLQPYIPPVASESMDSKGQAVFYGQMDLSMFEGTWDSGGACFNTHLGAAGEGLVDGIIVIYPQSTRNPGAAELIFWFNRELESGERVTHLLTMQGSFDEPQNWPPAVSDPQTTISLNYWEFAAENRKAQRQDCSGASDYPAGPWSVTVTRVTSP